MLAFLKKTLLTLLQITFDCPKQSKRHLAQSLVQQ